MPNYWCLVNYNKTATQNQHQQDTEPKFIQLQTIQIAPEMKYSHQIYTDKGLCLKKSNLRP